MRKAKIQEIGGEIPTNGAEEVISFLRPYVVEVEIEGTADLLFHRWNCEAIEAKAAAAKNSKAKKTDDVETYVYRNDEGEICIPGEYVRQAVVNAAKYRQDPRSPRKSAMDLYRAGIVSLTPLASLGKTTWDYLDKRRAVVQRNGVNRTRPAFKVGWRAELLLQVNLPHYIAPADIAEVLSAAGSLVGLGDCRPTYGRYRLARCEVA